MYEFIRIKMSAHRQYLALFLLSLLVFSPTASAQSVDEDTTIISLPFPFLARPFSQVQTDENGVIYVTENGLHIDRFDLSQGKFLSRLTLPQTIEAFAVNRKGTKTYTSFLGGEIAVVDHGTGGSSSLTSSGTASDTATVLAVAGPYLFASLASNQFLLLDRETGEGLDGDDGFHDIGVDYVVFADAVGRVFFGTRGISPKDLRSVEPTKKGLADWVESPHHGDFDLASPLILWPDESKVVVGSGNWFHSSNLSWGGSFGLSLVDLAFYKDTILMLREVEGKSRVLGLDKDLNVMFRRDFEGKPLRLIVHEDTLALVRQTDSVQILSIGLPLKGVSLPLISPSGSNNQVWQALPSEDEMRFVQMDDNGVLFFIGNDKRKLYQVDTRAVNESVVIRFEDEISALAVSSNGTEVYVGYGTGRVDVYSPFSQQSKFFTGLGDQAETLLIAGEHLFTVDRSRAWHTHALYSRKNGELLGMHEWREYADGALYVETLSRIVYLAGSEPRAINTFNGAFGDEITKPFQGDMYPYGPCSLFPDDRTAICSNGVMYDTLHLSSKGMFPFQFKDIAFSDEFIFVVDEDSGNALIRQLDYTFSILKTGTYFGQPRRLFVDEGMLNLIVSSEGQSQLQLINESLPTILSPTSSPVASPTSLPSSPAAFSLTPTIIDIGTTRAPTIIDYGTTRAPAVGVELDVESLEGLYLIAPVVSFTILLCLLVGSYVWYVVARRRQDRPASIPKAEDSEQPTHSIEEPAPEMIREGITASGAKSVPRFELYLRMFSACCVLVLAVLTMSLPIIIAEFEGSLPVGNIGGSLITIAQESRMLRNIFDLLPEKPDVFVQLEVALKGGEATLAFAAVSTASAIMAGLLALMQLQSGSELRVWSSLGFYVAGFCGIAPICYAGGMTHLILSVEQTSVVAKFRFGPAGICSVILTVLGMSSPLLIYLDTRNAPQKSEQGSSNPANQSVEGQSGPSVDSQAVTLS